MSFFWLINQLILAGRMDSDQNLPPTPQSRKQQLENWQAQNGTSMELSMKARGAPGPRCVAYPPAQGRSFLNSFQSASGNMRMVFREAHG